jgi:hypothetical protein
MTESRQQRRARERRKLREQIGTRVEGRVTGSRTILDLWRTFYDEVLKPRGIIEGDPDIDPGLALMRQSFYGGAASMMELMMRVSPDDVSEDEGAAMLQRLYEELVIFAKGLR